MTPITDLHVKKTHDFMSALKAVCTDRKLPVPAVRDVRLTELDSRVYALAVFPHQFGHKLEDYENPNFLHQISSALHGTPVMYSNSTGFRLIALIDGPREFLPSRIVSPDHQPGRVLVGRNRSAEDVSATWTELGHVLIAGETNSGKTSFVRALGAAALSDGLRIAVGDLHNSALPMLKNHPQLLAPIARTPAGMLALLQDLIKPQIEHRIRLYEQLHEYDVYPENLEDYNAACAESDRLERWVVFLDEFSSACLERDADGKKGENSALAQIAFQCVAEGRKFGLNLVFSGQTFDADIVGKMREQLTTRLCFKVMSAPISRTIVQRSGAEKIAHPGRALTNCWGLIQTFHYEQARLITLARAGRPDLSHAQHNLAARCRDENAGKFTEGWLCDKGKGGGLTQGQARKLQQDWFTVGYIAKDPAQGNAYVLTTRVLDLLDQPVEAAASAQAKIV